jgi:hypothetical protein
MKGDNIDRSNSRGTSLVSTTYKILSSILLLRSIPYAEDITGIISMEFDLTGQLLITYSALNKYLIKNGNTMRPCIS